MQIVFKKLRSSNGFGAGNLKTCWTKQFPRNKLRRSCNSKLAKFLHFVGFLSFGSRHLYEHLVKMHIVGVTIFHFITDFSIFSGSASLILRGSSCLWQQIPSLRDMIWLPAFVSLKVLSGLSEEIVGNRVGCTFYIYIRYQRLQSNTRTLSGGSCNCDD